MTEGWTAVEWTRLARRCEQHGVEPPEVVGCDDVLRTPDYDTSCAGVFRCTRCRRLVCWCQGGGDEDERGDYCCECYAAVTCVGCDDGVLRLNGRPSGLGTCDQCGKAVSIHQDLEALARERALESEATPPIGEPESTKGWRDDGLKLGG